MERRQARPLPERPPGDACPAPFPVAPDPAGGDAAPRRAVVSGPVSANALELPEDLETRPDGTPGSLAAHAPKAPVEVFVLREAPINLALATRPKLWRQVNVPQGDVPEGNKPEGNKPEGISQRGISQRGASHWGAGQVAARGQAGGPAGGEQFAGTGRRSRYGTSLGCHAQAA